MTETLWIILGNGFVVVASLGAIAYVVATCQRNLTAIMAQADESRKMQQRQAERFANKLCAMRDAKSYATYRSLASEPETPEAPVPHHTPDDVADRRAKLKAAAEAQLLRQKIDEIESARFSGYDGTSPATIDQDGP